MTIHSAKEPLPDLEQCEFPIQVEHKGGKVRVYQITNRDANLFTVVYPCSFSLASQPSKIYEPLKTGR